MIETNRPILVAEDEESDALILQLACRKAAIAHPLVIVADGQEVVDYLSGKGRYADRSVHPLPALIVLDLKMPRMTGFDVLGWLASQREVGNVPAVVLSSSPDESDIAKARRLGAREYFVKPHQVQELVAIVLRMKAQWLEAEAARASKPSTEIPVSKI
jgi:CheY-like chemotaxis protein